MSSAVNKRIIKLGLWKEGEEPIFRNVPCLPHIMSPCGLSGASQQFGMINRLKCYAIAMFLKIPSHDPEESDNINLMDYKVTLTYKDNEGDKMMIYNDQDICNAFEEIPEKNRVKMEAWVSLKNNPKRHTAIRNSRRSATTSTQTAKVDSEEKVSQRDEPQQQQRSQNPTELVDAVTDLMTCVAMSVNSGIHSVKDLSKESVKQVKTQAKGASSFAIKSIEVADTKAEEVIRKATSAVKSLDRKVRTSVHTTENTQQTKETDVVRPMIEEVMKKEPKPFIHGRHTCDQCLTTPIIGKRFHATNLPDYDLCETCCGNYKGSEILFEEAQLDRDIPFQDRWNAKYIRYMTRRSAKAVNSSPGNASMESFSSPCTLGADSGPSPTDPQGPSTRRCHYGLSSRLISKLHKAIDTSCWSEAEKNITENVDAALEEAIRRSLLDVKAEEDKDTSKSVPSDEKNAKSDLENESSKEGCKYEEQLVVERNDWTEGKAVAALEEAVHRSLLDVKVEEDNHTNNKDTTANSVVESESTNEGSKEDENVSIERNDKNEGLVVAKSDLQGMTISPDRMTKDQLYEVFEGLVEEINQRNASESNSLTNIKVTPFASVNSKEKNDSFVEDACGDAAIFLGETLDRMADAIDSLQDVDDDDQGAKIVDGEEIDIDVDSGWSVVDEEERMARATEALGSALFNSDLRSSMEEQPQEDLITAEEEQCNVSSVTSVPSTIRSLTTDTVVPQVLLERWDHLLYALHELGFLNDAQSIDVIETLAAANIGVDSDEEVTVEQVINQLIKDW